VSKELDTSCAILTPSKRMGREEHGEKDRDHCRRF
jgi:hypothetical protein